MNCPTSYYTYIHVLVHPLMFIKAYFCSFDVNYRETHISQHVGNKGQEYSALNGTFLSYHLSKAQE